MRSLPPVRSPLPVITAPQLSVRHGCIPSFIDALLLVVCVSRRLLQLFSDTAVAVPENLTGFPAIRPTRTSGTRRISQDIRLKTRFGTPRQITRFVRHGCIPSFVEALSNFIREIEPPGEASVPVAHPMLMRTECRPCPPLPLDGPILMEFMLHSQPNSDTLAPSLATSIVPISKDLELISTVPIKTSATGSIQDSHPLSGFDQSPGTGISDAMAWDLSLGRCALMWLAMAITIFYLLAKNLATTVPLADRADPSLFVNRDFPDSDVVSGFCPVWQCPENVFSGTCPRLDSRTLMPESSFDAKHIYGLCLSSARRGSAAWGLIRTYSALVAKKRIDTLKKCIYTLSPLGSQLAIYMGPPIGIFEPDGQPIGMFNCQPFDKFNDYAPNGRLSGIFNDYIMDGWPYSSF
ncbi:hypothetical protein B0H11DRAFT_1927649 [Mycena galericulata]|nr:hypothetical protein B0H11DRAFT_1927649 [Mycena galericulata]